MQRNNRYKEFGTVPGTKMNGINRCCYINHAEVLFLLDFAHITSFKFLYIMGKDHVSQPFITMTKYPRQLTYKEERFVLAHGFRGFSTWLLISITMEA
jgi:hypothetical protein